MRSIELTSELVEVHSKLPDGPLGYSALNDTAFSVGEQTWTGIACMCTCTETDHFCNIAKHHTRTSASPRSLEIVYARSLLLEERIPI